MVDDTTVILREIADLLRQRNDQQVETTKRMEERLATTRDRVSAVPAISDMRREAAEHIAAGREEAARRRAEDLDFRERLLAAIERQNALLAQLVERSSR